MRSHVNGINTHRANSSSAGGILTSKHLITWFAFNPPLNAIIPARSKVLSVKSKCSSETDSGRNSASAIAAVDEREVEERKSRFREVLSVKAVRRD